MTTSRLVVKRWFYVVIGVIFALYVIFQARFIIFGPQVSIDSPKDGTVLNDPVLNLTGHGSDIAYISLNDRQIFTNENGQFSEKLILAQGLSIMTVRVRDRFGRERVESVRIILD